MAATKGLFSIIQFCPDLDRFECANVGIMLSVPQDGFLRVRFTADNEGPKRRFGAGSFDEARLNVAKKAIEGRILEEGKLWKGIEDVASFSKKEGNHLILGPGRVIMVQDAEAELQELYQRLVHLEHRHRKRTKKPNLDQLFTDQLLTIGVPLIENYHVDIPELGDFRVPYAYRNGRVNLLKPEAFPMSEDSASSKLNDLAVKGHLISRQPSDRGEEQKLIVVAYFDDATSEKFKNRAEFVLKEHDSRLVQLGEIDAFIDEIRREAH